MKKFSFQFLLSLILLGCSVHDTPLEFNNSSTSSQLNNVMKQMSYDPNYSIHIPRSIPFVEDTELGSFAWTYDQSTVKRSSADYSVAIYDKKPSPCSPSLTGASTTTPLPNANGTAEWGRVDFFEKYAGEGYVDYMGETPLCAEPGSAKDRYALCSHKDGKTVVICISQMTQNEPLAKQIFETFRWTK